MMTRESAKQKAIRKRLQDMQEELLSVQEKALEKYKIGKIKQTELDQIQRMVCNFKNTVATSFSAFDLLTKKEKAELALKEEDYELKKSVAEIQAELALLKVEKGKI